MAAQLVQAEQATCPECGHGEARARFDQRDERIAITCTGCGRTDIRLLDDTWSAETQRAAVMIGVELRFTEPS